MKTLILFILIALKGLGQTPIKKVQPRFATLKYAGKYSIMTDIEKESVRVITIYPASDTSILFYFEGYRKAPYYKSGALYGWVQIKGDSGTFFKQVNDNDAGCKINFRFRKSGLILTSISEGYCGFGFGVYPDGKYARVSKKHWSYFTDRAGTEVYFDKVKPEEYVE